MIIRNRSSEPLLLGLVYLMFFLSGAAALVYEVVWVRSLSLIFGGTHLAVTTVLSVFMGGLALGSYVIGRYGDRIGSLLKLYGILELGIALFAILFAGLVKIYPLIYIALARDADHSQFYLSFIRVLFAVVALIGPTTLMGGTLPVLSRFVSERHGTLGRHLSFLYGINTLGAVVGTMSAGFLLLRYYSVSTSLIVAIVTNTAVGLASFLLAGRFAGPVEGEQPLVEAESTPPPQVKTGAAPEVGRLTYRLVLVGIGISGFCALGYEVLWTRILTIVVGASVYGFTIMLAAFLTGIALGSKAYGLLTKVLPEGKETIRRTVAGFGVVEIIIGVAALMVTFYIRDLPSHSLELKSYFSSVIENVFESRQWANLALAFFYMLVPAFFMGLAFPLAGTVNGAYRKNTGRAVGEVLAYNTVGAILGAAVSGYVMAYFLSIEQSLQMLTVINIGFGLIVIASIWRARIFSWGASAVTVGALILLAVRPDLLSTWDKKYFAIFRANQPEAFGTPEMVREAIENTEVLYFAEGVEAIVSSIKIKGGGNQAFITNGRVEASSNYWDQQVQYTLGHLPMLLNKDPKKVLVVGLGSGMTLGATSVHPEVEEVTLIELEPRMLGVAQTFGDYNHNALDSPKLRIIFNDGRNFLLTTKEKFDVITADPIHPWFRGAGYLYTKEYFSLASDHLREGGVMCQWLPIYELTPENLKSVVRTFRTAFKYTVLWLTYYDSVIVGSNDPIMFDESDLERRIAVPEIKSDLERVYMASSRDLLSYFAMGPKGMDAFGEEGILNTDDNLYLEFSAPLSVGKGYLMQGNVRAIVRDRESILPFLVPEEGEVARRDQINSARYLDEAARRYDPFHALFLGGSSSQDFFQRLTKFRSLYPWYGPGNFLDREFTIQAKRAPRLIEQSQRFFFSNRDGRQSSIVISAVVSPVSPERAYVLFVDNDARIIYGKLLVTGTDVQGDYISRFVADVIADLAAAYRDEARKALNQGRRFLDESFLERIRTVINEETSRRESAPG